MEKHPIREAFSNVTHRLGQMVVGALERRDDALDVYGIDFEDTQEMDLSSLFTGEDNESAR